jgi:HEAT repeat protein
MKLAFFLFAGALAAQTPQLTNAKLETRAGGDLNQFVAREGGALWFGYAVDSNEPESDSCCGENNSRCGCYLEGGSGGVKIQSAREPSAREPSKLEGSRALLVLYRVQDHAIQKIRPFSANCPIDAGGMRFVWLTGVTPQASVQFLASLSHRESALAAIAMHATDAADRALERFAQPSNDEQVREKALFWMASARGDRGFREVAQAARNDPSENIRQKAMFDLSLCKQAAATEALIDFAKHDSSPRVREQAIFWLAQKAGQKAVGEIRSSIDNDPNTEVKKKAVFALSQLADSEGVPLLIEVAKTNSNPEVRKQAMFWLGQSHDPRALAYFEQVLAR